MNCEACVHILSQRFVNGRGAQLLQSHEKWTKFPEILPIYHLLNISAMIAKTSVSFFAHASLDGISENPTETEINLNIISLYDHELPKKYQHQTTK